MQSIFGTDGIRGIFNKEISYKLAFKVGYALGVNLTNPSPIIIGRDTRVSGEIIFEAITSGIASAGKEFINLGICPTPAIPFLIKKEQFSSGIMISASHNPPEYNGIKIFNSNGEKIKKDFENKIVTCIEKITDNTLIPNKIYSINANQELLDKYISGIINSMGDENLEGLKIFSAQVVAEP